MRSAWLIVVGISVLACKDKEAARPAEQPSAPGEPTPASRPAAPTPDPTGGAMHAPERPQLDPAREFDEEREDRAWADATEQAITAVAPELRDVTCRERQCRATLAAATEAELVALTNKLERDDALPSTEARNILLTEAKQDGGKVAMTIYIRYDR
jgi:hypothetical protein